MAKINSGSKLEGSGAHLGDVADLRVHTNEQTGKV